MTDFNAMAENLDRLLEQEASKIIACADDLRERYAIRDAIHEVHGQISMGFDEIARRVGQLVRIPGMEHVEWANAILAMPNLCFLVLDTTGVQHDSDIIRVLVADVAGRLLLDYIIHPQRQRHNANTRYTGILQTDLLLAPSLPEVWNELREVLKGRFVLSYGLEFVKARLTENAKHYGLSPIFFIGQCLQQQTAKYYNTHVSQKLVDVCNRLGHKLPDPPLATDRVGGQLVLLKAMSQGMTDVKVADPLDVDTFDDEHPF